MIVNKDAGIDANNLYMRPGKMVYVDGPTMIAGEMESLFEKGGSPDIVYMTLESAHHNGVIGCLEFQCRKVLRSLRLPQPPVGVPNRSVRSGGPSAPPTRGITTKELREALTPVVFGTSSTKPGEPSSS